MIEKIGGRKVIIGAIVLTIAVAVSGWMPNGLTTTLADVLKFVAVGFFLGNGIEHTAKAFSEKKYKTIEDQLTILSQQVALVNEQNAATQQAISLIMDKAGVGKQRGGTK